jgi:hypothetical protein
VSVNALIYVSSAQQIHEACMAADAQPLAVVTDYEGLVAAMRERLAALNTTMGAVDTLAGLPDYYTAKVLSGARGVGPISFGPLLGALGLKLAVMPDDDALAKVRHRLPLRGHMGPKLLRPSDQTVRARRDKKLATALRRLQKAKAGAAA